MLKMINTFLLKRVAIITKANHICFVPYTAREDKKWSKAVDEKPLPFSLLVTIAVKFYSQQDGKDTGLFIT